MHLLITVTNRAISGTVIGTSNQARIQGVGARAGAHPWDGVTPLKIRYSIAFKHQSVTGRPPLGEILYPPLLTTYLHCTASIAVTGSTPARIASSTVVRRSLYPANQSQIEWPFDRRNDVN